MSNNTAAVIYVSTFSLYRYLFVTRNRGYNEERRQERL